MADDHEDEFDEAFWEAVPPATDAEVARVVEMARVGDVAEVQVLRALIEHYHGWSRVPRQRRGPFADYTPEQIREHVARIEREPSQGRRPG